VEHHQEVLHAEHHIDGEERHDQRESKIFELSPSARPVNGSGFINILRHCLQSGNVNDGIHSHRLPAGDYYDGKPRGLCVGEHTAGEPFNPRRLSGSRQDVGEKETKNITYNQTAQNVWKEIDCSQGAFRFDLTVQAQPRIRLSTFTSIVLTRANLKVKR